MDRVSFIYGKAPCSHDGDMLYVKGSATLYSVLQIECHNEFFYYFQLTLITYFQFRRLINFISGKSSSNSMRMNMIWLQKKKTLTVNLIYIRGVLS
jgi:hypothetical protein